MARRPPLPTPSALRRRREHRTQRLLANRAVADALVSAAGLVGRPVRDRRAAEVGRLLDLVVRWRGEPYPPVTGLVVRVGRRRVFVPIDHVEEISTERVTLRSVRLDLRDFERRDGRGGAQRRRRRPPARRRRRRARRPRGRPLPRARRRASTGSSASTSASRRCCAGSARRAGGVRPDARPRHRLGRDPAVRHRQGRRARPGPMRLHTPNQALRRLRPGELADLLEELGRDERQELLAQLETETAADALEEMEPEELGALLRESTTEHAASLLAEMEPDEAVDALRDLEPDEADELLAIMPPATRPIAARAAALPRGLGRWCHDDEPRARASRARPSARSAASCAARPSTRPTSTR